MLESLLLIFNDFNSSIQQCLLGTIFALKTILLIAACEILKLQSEVIQPQNVEMPCKGTPYVNKVGIILMGARSDNNIPS